MTQEQINEGRIAIAERLPHVCSCDEEGEWRWRWPRTDPFNPHMDLNAMHEAEEALWYGDLKRLHTDAVLYDEWCRYRSILANNIHATAPQRFEAMLRVLGAWQEDAS